MTADRYQFCPGVVIAVDHVTDEHSTLHVEYEIDGEMTSTYPPQLATQGDSEGYVRVVAVPRLAVDPLLDWYVGLLALRAATAMAAANRGR